MSTFVHKPSQSERTGLRRNTGFPEPLSKGMISFKNLTAESRTTVYFSIYAQSFCLLIITVDRNTTLPHPDADTSEGATIEAQEVIVLNHTRPLRSILPFQHFSNGNSKGGIIGGPYDNIQDAHGSNHDRNSKELEQKAEGRKDISDAPTG